MMLKDILYVPRLGVNLVLVRKLCQRGLKGSFDKTHIYFKHRPKTVDTIIITNSLYIIIYVLKKYKDIAFIGIKTYKITTNDKSNNEATKETDLERYLKYH